MKLICVSSSPSSPATHSLRAVGDDRLAPLQRGDLLATTGVTSPLDLRREECVNDALRQRLADHPLAERQQIHVDVLDAVACGPFVLDDRCAHAGDLVRGDRGADPRAAKEDPAFDVTVGDRLRKATHDQRVIVVGSRLRPESDEGVTGRLEMLDDSGLETLAGVVGGDPDLHATVARTSSISASLIAPRRRILTWSVVQSTTVDETPPGVRPPSRTSAIRPSSCAMTSSAVRGSGSPERFALVTGRPPPLAAMSRRARG